MAVFMLYFFVLREERDIDNYLANIYDQNLAGDEMLKTIIEYKEQGKDTSGMESSYIAWGKEQKKAKFKAQAGVNA